jgi:DNA-binding GntR family transcriptional regulator
MSGREGKRGGRPRTASDIDLARCRKLDRKGGIPLYWQLSATLFENLEAGGWGEGARFPSERQLEEHFDVSRPVVRRALGILVDDGKVTRVQGGGTYVAARRYETRVFGLVDALVNRPEDLTVNVLKVRKRRPDAAVARFLAVPRNVSVAHVTAVIRAGDRHLGHIDTHVVIRCVPWLMAALAELQEGASPSEERHLELRRAELLLEHTRFRSWGGLKVGAAPGDPALMVRLLQYARAKQGGGECPVEFARLVYRSENTQLRVVAN